MNLRVIALYIGRILQIEGLSMLPALLIALLKHEQGSQFAFIFTIVLLLVVGTGLSFIRTEKKAISARDGFFIVGFSWIVLSLFGALPFYMSGSVESFLDCFFETVSGFTTTGASVIPDVEALPMSILYWRSFTHWLGGMGVLVFVLAIQPSTAPAGGAIKIMRAESPGPIVGKLVPKLRHTARILYIIYVVMTLLEIALLCLGGMPFFDSLIHSFGTAGTGGFGIKNTSIAYYDSVYIDVVIGIFMLLFGVNFNFYYLLLIRDFRSAFKSREVQLYFAIVGASVVAISLNTLSTLGGFGKALRYSFFQVASIITTTGYSTNDFNLWPQFSRWLLLALMVVGACAGSTGGGIKVHRVLIMIKSLRNTIQKMLHPKNIRHVRVDGKVVENNTLTEISAYVTIYVLVLVSSLLVVSLDNLDIESTLSGVLACLNNIGPGLGAVGPTSNFSALSPLSKLVLSGDMLLGRLEFFPLLMMFTPTMWRRVK